MECIQLDSALKQMDRLYENDISSCGVETLETFDAKRAKKALESLPKFKDIVRPVRCGECIFKTELFTADSEAKGHGFKLYDCEKRPGGYLGDNGYCSLGRIE